MALLLILLAAIWIHLPALRAPFLSDDYLFLDHVRHRGLDGSMFLSDPIGNYFRPLSRQIHFWVWSRAGAESPFVFHLVNLALFLAAIALLHRLVERVGGPQAGAIAAAVLALHAAADVPVFWVSGVQDLLAVTLALGALLSQRSGRAPLAAALFALSLLSKEIVVAVPLVAMLLGRPPGESWRAALMRTRWLWAVLLGWLVVWSAMGLLRGAAGGAIQLSPAGPIAALVHLAQAAAPTALWGEAIAWSRVGRDLVAVALAVAGVAVAAWTRRGATRGASPGGAPAKSRRASAARSLAVAGGVWAAVAALPIAPVVHQWSLYFYLFAACGVAVTVAGVLERTPRAVAISLIAVLGLLSSAERRAEGFATADDVWGWRSHVGLFYLERAAVVVERYEQALRRARPTVPPNSTFFFAGIPAYVGWQSGDGPLVRWVYRDSSVRAYYVNALDEERLTRGPAFFFRGMGEDLVDETDQPGLWRRLALPLLMARRDSMAERMLERAEKIDPEDGAAWYLHGWIRLAAGDTAGAAVRFAHSGVVMRGSPFASLAEAERALASGDSAAALVAFTHAIAADALDPRAHARLTGLFVEARAPEEMSIPEGYASLLLAPAAPETWYHWAVLQLGANRLADAERALAVHDSLARNRAPHPRANEARQRLAGLRPGGSERERVR